MATLHRRYSNMLRLDGAGVWRGSVHWVLRDARSAAALERSDFTYELGSGSVGPEDVARGLSDELARLGEEIAAGVRRHHPLEGDPR